MSEVQMTEKDREFLNLIRTLFSYEMDWATIRTIYYDEEFNVHVVLVLNKPLFTDYTHEKIEKIARFIECDDFSYFVEPEGSTFRVSILFEWEVDEDES
jgi:hypothetical protein